MSQHPSLRVKAAGQQHRNVLKRYERLNTLKAAGKWDAEKDSALGLPKVKSQKLKAKGKGGEKKEEVAEVKGKKK